jgi:hypothetical protein
MSNKIRQLWETIKESLKSFWGIVQGSLIIFTLVLVVYSLNGLGVLRSMVGYYNWLPNTQYAFNQFLKYVGIVAVAGSLADIIFLVIRWLRYGFQHPFFS